MTIEYGPWRHGMSNSAECEQCDWEAAEDSDRKVAAKMRAHLDDQPEHTVTHWRTLNRVVFVP